MAKKELLAWAAGFFDGEGSVGAYASGRAFYRGKQRVYVKVTITNTDRSLLERFLAIVGFGVIDGPYLRKKNPTWAPKYVYRTNGLGPSTVLFTLLKPYLGEAKAHDFTIALAAASYPAATDG